MQSAATLLTATMASLKGQPSRPLSYILPMALSLARMPPWPSSHQASSNALPACLIGTCNVIPAARSANMSCRNTRQSCHGRLPLSVVHCTVPWGTQLDRAISWYMESYSTGARTGGRPGASAVKRRTLLGGGPCPTGLGQWVRSAVALSTAKMASLNRL